jgi:hypothetical protein
MKKLLLAAASSILLMASCTQQNTPSPNNNNNNGGGSTNLYNIDSSYFFKINFQNKALYSYAVFTSINTGSVIFQGGPSSTIMNSSSGVIKTYFLATIGSVIVTNLPNATCGASLYLSKLGNPTGNYTNTYFSTDSYIKDLTSSKNYNIDTSTMNFNVSSIGLHNVTGTFSCKLIDGTTLIPATGSFNLYKP